MNRKILFLFLFLVCGATTLWAATATVTNNGNITVRVQYKTPDGQYQDLGYLKPGETVDVPGGVEKVRIVRDPGEWAAPLKPGEILDVEVKEGDKVIGKMDWYGDKVFFDGLSQGAPPPVVSTGDVSSGGQTSPVPPPRNPEPSEEEPKSEPTDQQSETKPEPTPTPALTEGKTTSNWPWYGGMADSIFFIQLFAMWPFLIFLWLRNWRQPRYYIEGEGIGGDELGWGWGWQDGRGCGRFALIVSLFFGLAIGALALWGHANFIPDDGLVPRFGQDLYSFPYFVLSLFGWGRSGISEISFILLFWVLTCTSFGLLSTIMPLRLLYATPAFLAILPFFLLTRGCAGCIGLQSFAFDGGYEGIRPYPAAFASFSLFSMLVGFVLDWVDPYYEMDEDEEDDVSWAVWDAIRGNPWPLLVALTGGCVTCFYGIAYEFGWQTAIGEFFHDIPLSLGLNFIPPFLMIGIFWMMIFGLLGYGYYSDPSRFAFYSCLIPAFLVFLFLMTGNYPQRYFDFDDHLAPYSIARVIQSTDQPKSALVTRDSFGDQVGIKGWKGSRVGRELLFQDAGKENRNWPDRYDER